MKIKERFVEILRNIPDNAESIEIKVNQSCVNVSYSQYVGE